MKNISKEDNSLGEGCLNKRKHHAAGQGIVATDSLETAYQRTIFFQVDPQTLDYIDCKEMRDAMPRGNYLEFDPEPFLQYLPELEAEIFWLLYVKKKNQKDVALLLDLSQPTVSYRYRRTLDKLSYLMTLVSIPIKEMVGHLPFLKDKEKEILVDLFFFVNQELVGKKHGIRQSSVKWIFVKAKKNLERLERAAPEQWFHHLGMMLLLERNLGMRVLQ